MTDLNHISPAQACDKICHVALRATGQKQDCVANDCMGWRFAAAVTTWSKTMPEGEGWEKAKYMDEDYDDNTMWVMPQSGLGYCSIR